ncbi:hypothetical protein GCM10011574_71890 [Microbispora bryophytorum]|uniref:Uncharacterized protein n=1 Tax=Microbispora bryophytorum TaxID=1460882 RepID=A0A8H9H9B6_9ACTN|nr:hypothetical protein GCM10011574_71890 [Microbispora bryophytorum]
MSGIRPARGRTDREPRVDTAYGVMFDPLHHHHKPLIGEGRSIGDLLTLTSHAQPRWSVTFRADSTVRVVHERQALPERCTGRPVLSASRVPGAWRHRPR